MIQFDMPREKSSIIKVIGVGGGGSNAVNFMFGQSIAGVDFVVCNTDAKAIEQSPVNNKIQLGPASTEGLGAGANPEKGRIATEESLQEIKNILEINTKMAFITAGMGGGTGTGGAPIIAKMCKDMGILTVGIVTTPFGFEGPKRMQQAEEGIKALKPHVDTLLVISNDKLRMQYGNLKMREAFGKADNVLATAAKCITDIINSKGHIIVDFADVCTVMKNGGVAILGSATAEGENRAQLAIEQALNSPLLNDNDIKGAKWILININSAEGDHECTMDEIDIINQFLRAEAGEKTDVIVGMGNDASLDKQIGITIIATGFTHKDPFSPEALAAQLPKEEKVILTLDAEDKKTQETPVQQVAIPFEEKNPYQPQLVEVEPQPQSYFDIIGGGYSANDFDAQREEELPTTHEIYSLAPETSIVEEPLPYFGTTPANNIEAVESSDNAFASEIAEEKIEVDAMLQFKLAEEPTVEATPTIAAGLMNKPTNIYSLQHAVESKVEEKTENIFSTNATELAITYREEPIVEQAPAAVVDERVTSVAEPAPTFTSETPANFQFADNAVNDLSEEEEQRKRAIERIQKLRNFSYSNTVDATTEFDNVPAYIRRKMELFGNALTTADHFYSKTTVEKNDNNEINLSSKNSFLDGVRPD